MKNKQKIFCFGTGSENQVLDRCLTLNGLKAIRFQHFEEFLIVLDHENPDGIIFDLESPGPMRIRELKRIRERFRGPLIVTGKTGSYSIQTDIFEAGADDFMNPDEEPILLLARLQAVRKRFMNLIPREEEEVIPLKGEELILNRAARRARIGNRDLNLTQREWEVFLYLLTSAGKAVSRDELLENTLEYRFDGYNRLLDTYIRNIRRKLAVPESISTIRGFGYRFETAAPQAVEPPAPLFTAPTFSYVSSA